MYLHESLFAQQAGRRRILLQPQNLTCDITIFCVYLPPDIASDDFIQAMSDIRANWDSNSVGLIIGDFNEPVLTGGVILDSLKVLNLRRCMTCSLIWDANNI
jgi:hypothetical protein